MARLLGRPRFTWDGVVLRFPTHTSLALAAHLAVRREGVLRAELATLLWTAGSPANLRPEPHRPIVLRLWSDEALGPVWRVRLEDVDGGEHWTFASVSDLCEFLAPTSQPPPHAAEGEDGGGGGGG